MRRMGVPPSPKRDSYGIHTFPGIAKPLEQKTLRHPRKGGDPEFPVQGRAQVWIPALAGMTAENSNFVPIPYMTLGSVQSVEEDREFRLPRTGV